MKRLILMLVSVFALSVASPAMADTMTVQITKSGFVPTAVTVQQGDTVTWKNVDATSHQMWRFTHIHARRTGRRAECK